MYPNSKEAEDIYNATVSSLSIWGLTKCVNLVTRTPSIHEIRLLCGPRSVVINIHKSGDLDIVGDAGDSVYERAYNGGSWGDLELIKRVAQYLGVKGPQ